MANGLVVIRTWTKPLDATALLGGTNTSKRDGLATPATDAARRAAAPDSAAPVPANRIAASW
jgi:hypothetical protein